MKKNKMPSDFAKAMVLISAFNVLSQEEQEAYIEATEPIEISLEGVEIKKDGEKENG
jgi:hypothetical protein